MHGVSICEHKIQRGSCKHCNIDGHLRNAIIHRMNKAKLKSNFDYLGCDIDSFKTHISAQFKEGMTFENHGDWHVDHILPLGEKGITIDEVIKRLHYKNTQPLWAKDNRVKSNKIISE